MVEQVHYEVKNGKLLGCLDVTSASKVFIEEAKSHDNSEPLLRLDVVGIARLSQAQAQAIGHALVTFAETGSPRL